MHTVAIIGFERTLYDVSEDTVVVGICAVVSSPSIDCPIKAPINVSFATEDNTAGIYKCTIVFNYEQNMADKLAVI